MSVYTPRTNIAACELTSNGYHIVLALEGQEEVIILQLTGPNVDINQENEAYGVEENNGKIFELKESDAC